MPHIRIRAMSDEQVAILSHKLVSQLAKLIETGEDNFTFERVSTQYFQSGKAAKSYPFVEVLWFARSKEVRDSTAAYLTEQVKLMLPQEDVAVVFYDLQPSSYYENGKHF